MRKVLYWLVSLLVFACLFELATAVIWASVRMWKDILGHG
jgi:hypothetical protein